ncbi:MAG: response regulator [Xanthomonadaceae bacterium]|nr:response regulator [Xanthomonadaceae bacterium]
MTVPKKTILVVDDEPDLVEILTDRLSLEGFATESASSGNIALKVLESKKIDVVVSDIRMRDGTGPEMFKKMIEKGLKTPVIFVTAYAELENDAVMKQARAVLSKPFDFNELKALIDGI